MRILLAGDTHGDQMHLRHLTAQAKRNDCSLVFVLGDFGYWEHETEGVEFLDGVNRHATRERIPVYFLDGNHDKTSLLLKKYDNNKHRGAHGFLHVRPMVRYARRGLAWKWADKRFIALGGAYSTDRAWRLELERKRDKPEAYWFPEEEMSDEDMAAIIARTRIEWPGGVDVMLAHDKPRAANPRWNLKDFTECWFNQDRLQMAVLALNPGLFVHGHLHYRYSDEIRIGSNPEDFCAVEGLDCNPEADHAEPRTYTRSSSWTIYDTDNGRHG